MRGEKPSTCRMPVARNCQRGGGKRILWIILAALVLASLGFFEPRGALEGFGVSPAGRFCSAWAQVYPEPVGYVNDFANVIPDGVEERMNAVIREVEEKTTAEIVVATVTTTGGMEIHDYSVELFTRWGIGKEGKDNGVLLVAAIEDRKLWIKTGYGLEQAIPDAVASAVYRDVLRPAFRDGNYGGGLFSAVQIVAKRIADAEGVTLASVDPRTDLPQRQRDDGVRGARVSVIFVAMFIILVAAAQFYRAAGYRKRGFPFWTIGGFSGGLRGGGFGGGFGGFGGGSCGGGGAGGGW